MHRKQNKNGFKLLSFLPVFGLVDVHTAVIPGELLTRLNALILSCELAGPVLLQLLYVGVETGDRDGWVAEHSRGLKIGGFKISFNKKFYFNNIPESSSFSARQGRRGR